MIRDLSREESLASPVGGYIHALPGMHLDTITRFSDLHGPRAGSDELRGAVARYHFEPTPAGAANPVPGPGCQPPDATTERRAFVRAFCTLAAAMEVPEREPDPRYFVDGLSTQPLEWVAARLSDLDTLLEQAGMSAAEVGAGDAEALRQEVPEITDVLGRLLDRVKAGQLALPPVDEELASARVGWL